jgi:serine/threonine protein phosphatase PrpC
MSTPQLHGVVVKWFEERRYGMILLQNGLGLPFQAADYRVGVPNRQLEKTLVRCQIAPHPYEPKKLVCKNVEPVSPSASAFRRVGGKVLVRSNSDFEDGRILGEGGETIVYRASVLVGTPRGDGGVVCTIAEDRNLGRWFALRVEPVDSSTDTLRPPLLLAGSTRKGTIAGKSVNDDSFLVTTFAGEEYWLAAVSDGVSGSKYGWWASGMCMELLWQSLERFEREVVERFQIEPREVITEWIDWLHSQFVRARRDSRKEHEGADATLAMAIGKRGDHQRGYAWAICGDSRIYEVKSGPSGHLMPIIDQMDLDDQRQKDGRIDSGGLKTSIGANPQSWGRRRANSKPYSAGTKILLCTDGVTVERSAAPVKHIGLAKQRIVFSALAKLERADEIQDAVEGALAEIARMGEGDDLTLVVVRP